MVVADPTPGVPRPGVPFRGGSTRAGGEAVGVRREGREGTGLSSLESNPLVGVSVGPTVRAFPHGRGLGCAWKRDVSLMVSGCQRSRTDAFRPFPVR